MEFVICKGKENKDKINDQIKSINITLLESHLQLTKISDNTDTKNGSLHGTRNIA